MALLENILTQGTVQRLGWMLVHFVWQAAMVALFLAILLKLLRKSSANLRYIVAWLALVAVVLLPAVTMSLIPVDESYSEAEAAVAPIPTPAPIPAPAPVTIISTPAVIEPPANIELLVTETELPAQDIAASPQIPLRQRITEALEPKLPYVVMAWLVGVLGLSVWYLGGWAQLQRLRRKMVKPVEEFLQSKLKELTTVLGINRAVEVMESAIVVSPTVIGWLKPVILLPASVLTGFSADQIEAILAHELAHIKRCDYLVNMLQTGVEILGFYHPAVWWISKKIRVERENCCDDIAVKVSGDRIGYAKTLALFDGIRAGQPDLAVAASGGSLFQRICRLIQKDSTNIKVDWMPSVIVVLLIISLLIPAGFALTARSEEKAAVSLDEGEVWGEALNGLRMRLTAPAGTTYKRGKSLPLVIEIQNVGDESISFTKLYNPLNFKITDQENARVGVQGYLYDHITTWENRKGSLRPGEVIKDTCYFERLRFKMPSPMTAINLQFALPTQKENPGYLPINKYSNPVTIRLKDLPFKHPLKSGDLPAEWTKDMELVYREGGSIFYGDIAIHIDGSGRLTTVGHRPREEQPIPEGRHEYILEPYELNELIRQLREFKIEQLNEYDGKMFAVDTLRGYISIVKGADTFSNNCEFFGSETKQALSFQKMIRQYLTKTLAQKKPIANREINEPGSYLSRGLSCSIEMESGEYRVGDPVTIEVKIKNTTDKPVDFYYQDLYVAENLIIENQKGEVIDFSRTVRYDWPHPKKFVRLIQPGETFTHKIKGRIKYKFLTADELRKISSRPLLIDFYDVACHITEMGDFTVRLRLTADDKTVARVKAFGINSIWTGTLQSNKVAFNVRPMPRKELEKVIATLYNGTEDEISNAIEVVGANAEKKAVRGLIEIIQGGNQRFMRKAGEALISIQDTSIVPELEEMYEKPAPDYRTEQEYKFVVMNALKNLESKDKANERFLKVLKSDAPYNEIYYAAEQLALAGYEPALDSMIELAKSSDSRRRGVAISTLQIIGHRLQGEKRKLVVEALLDRMKNDPDSRVRKKAVEASARVGGDSVSDDLVEALKDKSVALSAAIYLGTYGSAEALGPLQEYADKLKDETSIKVVGESMKFIRQRHKGMIKDGQVFQMKELGDRRGQAIKDYEQVAEVFYAFCKIPKAQRESESNRSRRDSVIESYLALIDRYELTEVEGWARLNVLALYATSGDMDAAESWYKQLVKSLPNTEHEMKAHIFMGLHWMNRMKDPGKAMKYFSAIPDPRSKSYKLIMPGGHVDFKGKFSSEEEYYISANIRVLKCYLKLGLTDDAERHKEKLIEAYPEAKDKIEKDMQKSLKELAASGSLISGSEGKTAGKVEDWGAEVGGLRCSVGMAAGDYRVGDPVVIDVKIKNTTDKDVKFYYQDLYITENLVIKNAKGEIVVSNQTAVYNWPHPKEFIRLIKPGGTFVHQIKGWVKYKFLKADQLKDGTLRPLLIDFGDVACNVKDTGKFTARLRLEVGEVAVNRAKFAGVEGIWTGTLESNEVVFNVVPMPREKLDEAIETLGKGNDKEIAEAIQVLSANADKKAVGGLMEIVKLGRGMHIRKAADALVRIQDTSIIPELMSIYDKRAPYANTAGEFKQIVLSVLKGLEDKQKINEQFVKVLKSGASVDERSYAVWELATANYEPALLVMIELAKKHEPRMQWAAIDALGSLGTRLEGDSKKILIKNLLEIMKTDPDRQVRSRAVGASAMVGGNSVSQEIIGALKDPNPWVTSYAATYLGRYGGPEAIAPLNEYINSIEKEQFKKIARESIKFIQQRHKEEIKPSETLISRSEENANNKESWGKAVDGLSVRLWADKTAWRMGETPTFSLDLRNSGKKTFSYVKIMEAHCQVEYDGQWYIWADPIAIDAPTWPLRPGVQANSAIKVKLVQSWGIKLGGKERLELTPGKHTVRVRFKPDGPEASAESNPIDIEILAAGVKPAIMEGVEQIDVSSWGKSVEGVQCRLRADKQIWKTNETVNFKADIRNQGNERWRFGSAGPDRWKRKFCEVEFDGKWHSWSYPASVHLPDDVLHEYHQFNDVLIPLDERLGANVAPGRHVVRVAFFPNPWNPASRVVSKPVEIKILPPESETSHKPAEQIEREKRTKRVRELFDRYVKEDCKLSYIPELIWSDIPVLLELAQSENKLKRMPASLASSYAPTEGLEGMVALWLIETLRQRQVAAMRRQQGLNGHLPFRGMPMNAFCLKGNRPAKECESSLEIHREVLKLYQRWWRSVGGKTPGETAIFCPLEFTDIRWQGWQRWEHWPDIEIFKKVSDAGIVGQRIIREVRRQSERSKYPPHNKARTIYYALKPPADQKAPFTKEMLEVQKIVLHFYDDTGTHIKDKVVFPSAKASEDLLPEKPAVRVEGKEEWGEAANGLQCRLLPATQEAEPSTGSFRDKTVYVTYEMRNVSDKAMRFLPWYCPLEGVSGNIFKVVDKEGKTLAYRGKYAERMPPTAKSFVTIQPGKTLSRRVGLPYDFTSPGIYRITTTKTAARHDDLSFYYGKNASSNIAENPDRVWTGKLLSNEVTVNIVAGKGPWGEPSKQGLAIRLRSKPGVPVDVLEADLGNKGYGAWMVLASRKLFDLEVDGKKYVNSGEIVAPDIRLEPGQILANIAIPLAGGWLAEAGPNDPLKLTPGKHTIRIGFIAEPADRNVAKPVPLMSNPVEIEFPLTGQETDATVEVKVEGEKHRKRVRELFGRYVRREPISEEDLTGTYDKIPKFVWQDIPILLELAQSDRELKNMPKSDISSYLQMDGGLEGMVALWRIEGIRQTQVAAMRKMQGTNDKMTMHGLPLNPICIKGKMAMQECERSREIHQEVLELYRRWWSAVGVKTPGEAAIFCPLELTDIRWASWQRWEHWSDMEMFEKASDSGIVGQRIVRELEFDEEIEEGGRYRPGKKARTIYYALKQPALQTAPFTKEMLKVQKIVLHFYDDTGKNIGNKVVFPSAKASEVLLPDSPAVQVEGSGKLSAVTDLTSGQAEPQRKTDEVRYEGRTIEEWISQFDSKSYDDRREVIAALVRIGRPVVPAMIEQMKKGGMRASCARGVLREMGPEAEDAVPWLIKVALDKEVPIDKGWESKASYREDVVSCLNSMTWARDQVIPVLQRIAQDNEDDTRLRRVAVLFLRDIGKEAIPILRKVTETQDDEIQKAAHHMLAQVLLREQGLSKEDYYTPLIEKDLFDARVPEYLAVMKSPGPLGHPHPLTQKIKRLYRQRLEEEPNAQLAWQLAAIIQYGLRNTELTWAAPAYGSKRRWPREDPTENYTTLAEVLQLRFDRAESGSQSRREFGIILAKLRLLQSDWVGMNAMLKELGQEPIPKESRRWLAAPPVDWRENLSSRWVAADESMRSGNCSLEFKIEKDGKGLKGAHFLVKRAPKSRSRGTGIDIDTLLFQPYPYSFGYRAEDRPMTRYAVSDESGIVRFSKLPEIPVKIEVLVPTSNFIEAQSDWELLMEVEPGTLKVAKMYGAPEEVIDVRKPPAVVELKEGETVYYPRLVVRPALGRLSL